MTRSSLLQNAACAVLLIGAPLSSAAEKYTAEQIEFFEKKIRPVLAQECYECHSSATKSKGGLTLDTRKGWQEGGNSGEAIVPGDVKNSLLLQSIRHEDPELKMPKAGAKFDAQTIRDFETWVKMGAPDPREKAPSPEELAADTAWEPVLQRRKAWWSFQPVQSRAIPQLQPQPANPVDAFLREKLDAAGLAPAGDAVPAAFFRRLHFVLTGLPPQPEAVLAFEAAWKADRDGAVNAAVDRLLASPAFGERWARHWMDWVRYAETHGSEGDPQIPHAWRYRDYLIRALNADVPYPQLVREQIAGDLLAQPRINPELGLNESALGAAQLRMVLHGFTPTDAHDELVTFTDNQIDTVSKAFQGITVSCARCHNHKFDPISQSDFYAWYGIFTSGRPALIDVNTPEKKTKNIAALNALKPKLRAGLAAAWLNDIDNAVGKLAAEKDTKKLGETPAFASWARLAKADANFAAEWSKLRGEASEETKRLAAFRAQDAFARWDFTGGAAKAWFRDGPELKEEATPAGEFLLHADGPRVVNAILPRATLSSVTSAKRRAVLSSPPLQSEGGKIWIRLRGSKATARYVVRNYPRSGLIFPKQEVNTDAGQWFGWDLEYWKGDQFHFEITTGADHPIETINVDRSWYAISDVVYVKDGKAPAPRAIEGALPALCGDASPKNADELSKLYSETLRRCVEQWRDGTLNDDGAEFLSAFVRRDWLKNTLEALKGQPELEGAIAEYRKLEAEIPLPTRAPGVLDAFPSDQPLYTRGNHKKPEGMVARKFLDALDPAPFNGGERSSGRLELAEKIASPGNPLTSRVLVNRVWHYVFGRGIFLTPDNTGRLGEAPSHPELLDYLASRFQSEGGSIKGLLRLLLTTQAFRQSHKPAGNSADLARKVDPENRLLGRYSQQRLDAESLRDSLVQWTGRQEHVPIGSAGPGADGNALKRSVYVRIIRNNLDPLLSAFDFPVPAAPRGARDSTNVPAQSLALLNSPQVSRWALEWARRIQRDPKFPADEARVERLWFEAFGRAPRAEEVSAGAAFVRQQNESKAAIQNELSAAEAEKNEERAKVLREQLKLAGAPEYGLYRLAQAIVNMKEFIYVR